MVDLANFDVKFVDGLDVIGGAEFVIRTRMHEAPSPLLGDDPHRLVGLRQLLLDVVPNLDGEK